MVAVVTPGFQKSAEKLDAMDVITSTKANSLRKRAYQEVNNEGRDPANAAAYGDVFERLANHRTDKPTTAKYLRNAAVEFKNHKRIVDAQPVVEAALKRAAKTDEWKGVVDFARGIQTMSSFGSPNTPVGFIVAMHFETLSRQPEYYAEKLADLIATDATLAPYRDLINTLVVYGYGSYKLPAERGKNDLVPKPIQGDISVPGAPAPMGEVLADVKARGRVLMSEADKLFYPVYFKHFESFPTLESIDRYQAGLKNLIPFADHKMVKRSLENAITEADKMRTSIQATNVVAALLADPATQKRFAKELDPKKHPPEPLSSGVRIWTKKGTDWRRGVEISKVLQEMAKAVPEFPREDIRIDASEIR